MAGAARASIGAAMPGVAASAGAAAPAGAAGIMAAAAILAGPDRDGRAVISGPVLEDGREATWVVAGPVAVIPAAVTVVAMAADTADIAKAASDFSRKRPRARRLPAGSLLSGLPAVELAEPGARQMNAVEVLDRNLLGHARMNPADCDLAEERH
jgi:hypothetical protein